MKDRRGPLDQLFLVTPKLRELRVSSAQQWPERRMILYIKEWFISGQIISNKER
jgi:hypothetical protein